MKKSLLSMVLLSTALHGCASFPRDISGQYIARSGDFIVIDLNGNLSWSPPSKTRDQLSYVGIVGNKVQSQVRSYLAISSNSPLFGTSITLSEDKRRIAIEWINYSGAPLEVRATEYFVNGP